MADEEGKSSKVLMPMIQFAWALIKGARNDLRNVFMTLFGPLLILVIFWMVTRTRETQIDLLGFIFPAIVGMTVMLGGQPVATRIITWRQQGILQRLACTPVPVGHLVLGAGLAQLVLAIGQGLVILLSASCFWIKR